VVMIQFDEPARIEAKDRLGPAAIVPTPAKATRRRNEYETDALVSGQVPIVLIEPRTLIRDCLVTCLETASAGESVLAFATASDWLDARVQRSLAPLILFGTSHYDEAEIQRELAILSDAEPRASIVLLADDMDSAHVLGALDKGARGYISTSMSFDVAVKALHLVRAGGTFVPVESLRTKARAIEPASGAKPEIPFTARQLAVIEALRQGKANKIIAYELNMCESTVKVHVRNIMKKLHAKNRTEVAYRVNAMASLACNDGSGAATFTKSLP
jgi:DNA-binding NarL/FixJ family response regulator